MEKVYFHFHVEMLLAFLLHLWACLAMAATNTSTDQSALLALKLQITSDPHQILANWSTVFPVCGWAGVTCGSRNRRVIALDIGNMGLVGTIPPQLGNLSFLVYLNLSRNSFHGNLPHELGSLRRSKALDFGVNQLTGEIPSNFGSIPGLQFLSVANNSFAGFIPTLIYNISNLVQLWLHFNFLQGTIPVEIGNLVNLNQYIVYGNKLTGFLPAEIFNISTLEWASLGENYLSGSLPNSICNNNQRINRFTIGENFLSGPLPSSFSNCSQLGLLELSGNNFSGSIPKEYGSFKLIKILATGVNNLTGTIPKELGNLTTLQVLNLRENHLTGCIPEEIGNLHLLQQLLFARNHLITGSCKIKDKIPDAIGNLSSLIHLDLFQNELTGSVPSTIKYLQKLQILDVGKNKLGRISLEDVCALQNLFTIDLSRNQFSGSIPECIGNMTSLRYVHLQSNGFSSSLPKNLWRLQDLLQLNLSSNFLTGSLPLEVANLKATTFIDLSYNQLFGDLPRTIGDFPSLQILNLAHNQFQESLPETIGEMSSLETLNLSHNNLSGFIPKSLERLAYLTSFDVSFNNLSGEIPSGGPFQNFTVESFISNKGLCGLARFHVTPCPSISSPKLRTRKFHQIGFLIFGVMGIVGLMALGVLYVRLKIKRKVSSQTNPLSVNQMDRFSYFEILQATNGYDESNLLGKGSFGSVYKATLNDGRISAVKVFNLQVKGASKSFEAECEALRKLHHRNLTKVLSCCSNLDFKALVFEFIPNGSLEKWLYSYNYYLDIIQRLNIMIDVANALHYLHFGYSVPVVHCDLKPSNVLLDQDMVAHVSDFGIAKILGQEHSMTYTETLATFGYLAPEYGLEGLVSTKGDVYSFGIMLMEVFTRTSPNDEMFKENLTLKVWVSNFLPNSLNEIIDSNLLGENEEYLAEKLECVSFIMKVALNCSRDSPKERSTIADVVVALEKIKVQLLTYY